MITVDAEMMVVDDEPTRQIVRPLHANTQGEGTRQEMATDVANTDDLDNEDAMPAYGATNPPDESPTTDDPRQAQYRNKKIKLEKSAGTRPDRTRSRTRVALPNKAKI